MIERTKELIDKYKTLNQEELSELINLIVKEEKGKLGLSLPVKIGISKNEEKNVGGNTSLIMDKETKKTIYKINLNVQDKIQNFLNNKDKVTKYKNGVSFDNGMDSLFGLIAQISHEMRHAYQYECTYVKKDLKNINALLWIKEQMAMPKNVYEENYEECFTEQDSYNYMYKEALKYIDEYTNIKNENPKFYDQLQKQVERQKEKEKTIEETTCKLNGKEMQMTEALNLLFENRIKGIPQETIKKSILRYEYNDNRTKKSYEELMEDKDELIDKLDTSSKTYKQQVEKINKIYNFILENDKKLLEENAQEQKEEKIENEEKEQEQYQISNQEKEQENNIEESQEISKEADQKENKKTTKIVSTIQLGNETLEIQKDVERITDVEKIMNEHVKEYEEQELEEEKTFTERGRVSKEVQRKVNEALKLRDMNLAKEKQENKEEQEEQQDDMEER